MDHREILNIIAESALKKETVEIYYPSTENSPEGWREIEPYCISDGTESDSQELFYGKDQISPGHILKARNVGSRDCDCHSFIIGKIKKVRSTGRKFIPLKGLKIKF